MNVGVLNILVIVIVIVIVIVAMIVIAIMRPRKYVVLKGAEGFGDRLQCLLQAMRYAKKTGRTLVVDWRDEDWTHDPSERLEETMIIKGVLEIADFINIITQNKKGVRVYPSKWKECLLDEKFSNHIYESGYELPEGRLNEICENRARDFDEDIVVYAGIGIRTFNYEDAKDIEIGPKVRKCIDLKGEYDCIHLRGGSKVWMGGIVPLKRLDQEIRAKWPTQDDYLTYLYEEYRKKIENKSKMQLILVSDSDKLVEAWKVKYDIGTYYNTTASLQLYESGIHKIPKSELGHTTKGQMRCEMMRDFVLMLRARTLITDGISLFSGMAEGMRAAGVKWN